MSSDGVEANYLLVGKDDGHQEGESNKGRLHGKEVLAEELSAKKLLIVEWELRVKSLSATPGVSWRFDVVLGVV